MAGQTAKILAADIGGTNSRFLLFEVAFTSEEDLSRKLVSHQRAPGKLILAKKYQNEHFPSFNAVLSAFLNEAGGTSPPLTACLAVAGPVKDNVVHFTNRDSWRIDGKVISSEFGIKSVLLINDFLAVGYGLLTLDEANDCIVLQKADKVSTAPIACIGAGTGLGECFLTPSVKACGEVEYTCYPTEGNFI